MQPPSTPRIPSTNEVGKILQTYFLKKGYSPSELAFIQESSEHNLVSLEQLTKKFNNSLLPTDTETQLPVYIKLIKQDPDNQQGDLDATVQSFTSLREWILNALDLYKVSQLCHV
jgi:transcription initiation factor TFIID subunit 5